MKKQRVVVVGAGIGGLTAGALLAHRGYEVLMFDQALVPGGCASTFKRKGFTFDVGATQVAGLEKGGIHDRIFTELGIDLPAATYCDPACAVYLPHESEPINMWRDPQKWQSERQRHFPESEPFWQFLQDLFQRSWRFQSRDPILPPRHPWDLWQLLQAVRLDTLPTLPYTFSTVGDALRGFGLASDRRLRTFLDLQLKLYSQVNAEETALLYAATTLAVSQAPLGLFHLQGSMQVLSDRLGQAFERDGGKLFMQHTVEAIEPKTPPQVKIRNQRTGETWWEPADHVVANVTVQNLVKLLGDKIPQGYKNRVKSLKPSSGAFVVYLGVDQAAIPANCPPHLQFLDRYVAPQPPLVRGENIPYSTPHTPHPTPHSLFVSVSQPNDGRAPEGKATIIASEFVNIEEWWGDQDQESYQAQKKLAIARAIAQLGQYFHLDGNILYAEAATPQTFAKFTARELGMVGGIGMRVHTFGPFGFANRTPVKNVWLVGDCTHPGEGTAGVSYSALSAVRMIEQIAK